ncbi:hypothetical protein VWM73_12415, partial [Campylobacter coli]
VKLLDCQIHRHFKESLEFEPLFKEGFMGLKVDAQFLGEDVNILFMVAGLLLMVSSSNLILIFIGLESSSLALYTLIAMRGSNNA